MPPIRTLLLAPPSGWTCFGAVRVVRAEPRFRVRRAGAGVAAATCGEAVAGGREFDDPRLEYRRLFSELWGTFLLVLAAAGGGVIGATAFGADLTLAMKALAPGIMVMGSSSSWARSRAPT